jgi:hemolysin activation/secretion protein
MFYRASSGRTCFAITVALISVNLHAQQRPDSGTLQEQQRLLPALPAPGGPAPNLPASPAARQPETDVRILPTAFLFRGNTLFSASQLAGLLTARVNQPTDLAGLQAAAREIRTFYQDRGYLLTDVYVPEQALPSGGGPVTLAVVEARVGDVVVRGANIPEAARAIVRQGLQSGDSITGEGLDRPVLLIRDLSGYEATATVEPGARTGEASVILDVRASARQFDMSVGIDNHGTLAAGRARAFATLDASNLTGHGDALQARVQVSEIKETRLYRLNYTLPAFGSGKLSVAATRAEYALGKQFAALGASGRADIYGATLMYPLVRSRERNHFLSLGLEHKRLDDETAVSPATRKRVVAARAALLGNFADEWAGSAFTSYAASLTAGKVSHGRRELRSRSGPRRPAERGTFQQAQPRTATRPLPAQRHQLARVACRRRSPRRT